MSDSWVDHKSQSVVRNCVVLLVGGNDEDFEFLQQVHSHLTQALGDKLECRHYLAPSTSRGSARDWTKLNVVTRTLLQTAFRTENARLRLRSKMLRASAPQIRAEVPNDVALAPSACDLAIMGPGAAVTEAVMKSTKLGVLTPESDLGPLGAHAPGAAEVVLGRPGTRVLVRHHHRDFGVSVGSRTYWTAEGQRANASKVRQRQAQYTASAALDILNGMRLSSQRPNRPQDQPEAIVINSAAAGAYLARTLRDFVTSMGTFVRRSHPRPHWKVALTRVRGELLSLGRNECVELDAPPGSWFADPFVVSRKGESGVFVEEFVESLGRARIAYQPLADGIPVGPSAAVLEEPFHLSFPWTFEFADQVYMTPEAGASKGLRFYRATDYPRSWELVHNLFSGTRVVDPLVFEHAGLWYLLANIDPLDAGDTYSELHAFWASDPITTEWKAIPGNPQLVDPQCARNAGLIHVEGQLFRVGQRQGFKRYGEHCALYRIAAISPDGYQEVAEGEVHLTLNSAAYGPHHLSKADDLLAFDFVPRQPPRRPWLSRKPAGQITRGMADVAS